MASLRKRGGTYYIQYYVGGRVKRQSVGPESIQVAKKKSPAIRVGTFPRQ